VEVSCRRKLGLLLGNTDRGDSKSTGTEQPVVLLNLLASIGPATLAESKVSTTVLKGAGSDDTLHLGLLGVLLAALLLVGACASNDVLAYIIIVGEVEQLADLAGTLGTNTTGDNLVSEARDLLLALLHDDAVDHREIVGNDATTDSATTTHSVTSTTTITNNAGLEEKTNTVIDKNTLLHGETILIVTTSDAKDVALEFVTKRSGINLIADTHLHEDAKLLLIINIEHLLTTCCGTSDVDLHLCFVFLLKKMKK